MQVVEGEHETLGAAVAVKSEIGRDTEDVHHLLG